MSSNTSNTSNTSRSDNTSLKIDRRSATWPCRRAPSSASTAPGLPVGFSNNRDITLRNNNYLNNRYIGKICIYIYIYMYVCVYVYICVYIYIYIYMCIIMSSIPLRPLRPHQVSINK